MIKKGLIRTQIKVSTSTNQALWDEMAALGDWVHAPFQTTAGDGGAFTDTLFATPATFDPIDAVTSASEVSSFKGFGLNLPSVPNLQQESAVDANPEKLWYANEGSYPHLIDAGNWDKYLRIHNGVAVRYMTQPGGIIPDVDFPYHEIILLRTYPVITNETTGFWKQITDRTMTFMPTTPDIGSPNGSGDIVNFNRELWEYKVIANQDWELLRNGIVEASGTSATATLNPFSEWWIGANGHPLEHHFYFCIRKFGVFTAGDLTTIRDNSYAIWPKDTFPVFPVLDTINDFRNNSTNQWDDVNFISDLYQNKTVVFSGGSGTEGTHLFDWYYASAADNTTFPIGNKLDEHLPYRQGRVDLTGGASGSVDGITDDGVQIMSGVENFVTSLTVTAANVAANIMAHSTAHRAYASGTTVIITTGTGTIVSSTTTITTTDQSFTGDGNRSDGKLDRNHFISGNGRGNQTVYTSPGDGDIWFMCVIIPIDNLGVKGEAIVTDWQPDDVNP